MSKELEIIKDGTHLTSCSDKDVAVIDDRWLSWGDWWLGADPAMILSQDFEGQRGRVENSTGASETIVKW